MYKKLNFIALVSALFLSNINSIENLKFVFSSDGGLYVSSLKRKKVEKITSGGYDFRPSYIKTGNKIVFIRFMEIPARIDFRIFKTAVCTVNNDGSNLKVLTDGSCFDINATWSRDGKNNIIFSRYDDKIRKSQIFINTSGNPGEEKLISNPQYVEEANTCLKDGRIIIFSTNKNKYYALTPKFGSIGKYEEIKLNFNAIGLLDKISLSPDESKICFDMKEGFNHDQDGRTIYYGDFDVKSLTISNIVSITEPSENGLDARWVKDEKKIIFSSTKSGTRQLYIYNLKTKKITKISNELTNKSETPCIENTPN